MRATVRINPFRHMKYLLLSFFLLTTLSFEKAKAQVEPSFVRTDEGCLLEFFGEFGSAYFYQWSTDLTNWTYLPRADPGDEFVSLGFECNQPEFFLRLVTEDFTGSDPEVFDFDNDGLSSMRELLATPQLDPFNADTDGDQLGDAFELNNGLNGASSDQNGNGIPDSLDDFDGDGASNSTEQGNGGNPNDAIDGGEGVLSVISDAEDEKITETRSYSIPPGRNSYIVSVYVSSEEYPNFTEDSSEFNDQMDWIITPSNGPVIEGNLNVNSLHSEWERSESMGLSFNDTSPVAYRDLGLIQASENSTVTVDVEIGSTNIGDSGVPTTVQAVLDQVSFITPAGDPVDEPKGGNGAARGQNEFTYNRAMPGVLTMQLRASFLNIEERPEEFQQKFRFDIDQIVDSQMEWGPGNPGGQPTFAGSELRATVTFTNLPSNNSDFGLKTTRVLFDDEVAAEASFEVFYSGTARNHFDVENNPNFPNWFIYYRQNFGGGEYRYFPARQSQSFAGGGDDLIEIGNDAYEFLGNSYSNTSIENGLLTLQKRDAGATSYYRSFVGIVTHERHHANNETRDRVIDTDGDQLPSDFERNTSRTDPADPFSAGGESVGFNDGEVYANGPVERTAIEGADVSQDWANPGTNYNLGR